MSTPDIINQLKKYDLLHFESGESPITDTEYDLLKRKAKLQYPNDLYFNQVGYEIKSKYKTINLPYKMGGLYKEDYDTVLTWIDKYKGLIVGSEKLDGNSILCIWEKTKLIFAASRGDENVGQDILEKARWFIPNISEQGRVVLRGEVVLEGDLYKHFNFKNRRNGVTGLLRRDDVNSNDLKLLSVIFYEVIECPMNLPTEFERFEYIKNFLKLRTPIYFLLDPLLIPHDFIPAFLSRLLLQFKEQATYDIDGIVLSYNNSERENVRYPRNKVKFKVNEDAVRCKVIGIEWNVTRMGYIKPVILIEQINIMGVDVSRVSGFNYDYINQTKIGKGAEIGVVRSGDVIPYVTEVFKEADEVNIPVNCPTCNEPLVISSKELICNNDKCFYKNIQKVSYFFTKLDIDGISDKTIENLGITSIYQMFDLTKEKISKIPGFGEKKAINIVNEVQKSLKTKPWKLLAAFGIPLIGRTLSKQLCSKYTLDELFNIETPEELGLGDITSKTFIDNIGNHFELYNFLKSKGLQFEEENMSLKILFGKKFTLTGDGPIKRSEIQKLIEEKGGEVKSISKDTDYLVTNDTESNSGKMKSAIKYGTKIISYDELFKTFLK